MVVLSSDLERGPKDSRHGKVRADVARQDTDSHPWIMPTRPLTMGRSAMPVFQQYAFDTIKGIYGELVVSYCLESLPLLSVYFFLSSMSKIFSQGMYHHTHWQRLQPRVPVCLGSHGYRVVYISNIRGAPPVHQPASGQL